MEATRAVLPVFNPKEGIADMCRRLTGGGGRIICQAGTKYFYLDWNDDLVRCEDWKEPIWRVLDDGADKAVRGGCQAGTTDCTRDASILLHFSFWLGDSFARLREGGGIFSAVGGLPDRRNLGSISAVVNHGRGSGGYGGALWPTRKMSAELQMYNSYSQDFAQLKCFSCRRSFDNAAAFVAKVCRCVALYPALDSKDDHSHRN